MNINVEPLMLKEFGQQSREFCIVIDDE